MQTVMPLIISDSLPEALAQISQLRERLRVASTYNGKLLTPKMRAKLMTTLDEMEQDELKHAREREQERLERAKGKLDSAIRQRTVALSEAAAAADQLARCIVEITTGHAAAIEAAREVKVELPDVTGDLQQLSNTVTNVLRPLDAIVNDMKAAVPSNGLSEHSLFSRQSGAGAANMR